MGLPVQYGYEGEGDRVNPGYCFALTYNNINVYNNHDFFTGAGKIFYIDPDTAGNVRLGWVPMRIHNYLYNQQVIKNMLLLQKRRVLR